MIYLAVILPALVFLFVLHAYYEEEKMPMPLVYLYQDELFVLENMIMIGESQAISLEWALSKPDYLVEVYLPSHGFECLGVL